MQAMSEGTANTATTAGAWLRNARQQRGLHIAALAVMLKVPQAKLEALESDRFDLLPDATFARALATAMCRALKVDPAQVLALLPRSHDRDFDVRPGLNQPFRERGAGPIDGGVLGLVARPVVWAPVLLLLAAAAIYWIPPGWLPERGEGSAAAPAAAASAVLVAASTPAADFVAAPLAEPASAVAAASAPAPVPAPAASLAGAPPTPLPVASAPLQVRPVAPPPDAKPAAPSAGDVLRVTATAQSWVEVTDAKGQVLLSRLLREGEVQEFSGAPPYKLRVGNVGGTRLEWRGSAVDLAARANNNVARLELN